MAIIIKTDKEVDIIREGGKHLATVLYKVKDMVKPGISTKDLDIYAEKLIREYGDEPAFLNYRPAGVRTPYPSSLCTSVNNEVVHGIPKKTQILKEGDIISIDLGIKHKGLFTDMALTVAVGEISSASKKLLKDTEDAMHVGINAAICGAHVGDIGNAIETFAKARGNYGIVEILAGHGVGKEIHEDPFIPNFGKKGTGAILKKGMVIAIEPMLNMGTKNVVLHDDDYTYSTADGKRSAHFECTVAITDGEPEILTKI
ncbi:MAG: type I methionyl aminopeptidase [Candidatus Nomurabacteria bacterium]|nr:type I methionyl aminopeptidase [Candidatus Nomurabacteria bacterium]